jgi:hypothetical protein
VKTLQTSGPIANLDHSILIRWYSSRRYSWSVHLQVGFTTVLQFIEIHVLPKSKSLAYFYLYSCSPFSWESFHWQHVSKLGQRRTSVENLRKHRLLMDSSWLLWGHNWCLRQAVSRVIIIFWSYNHRILVEDAHRNSRIFANTFNLLLFKATHRLFWHRRSLRRCVCGYTPDPCLSIVICIALKCLERSLLH